MFCIRIQHGVCFLLRGSHTSAAQRDGNRLGLSTAGALGNEISCGRNLHIHYSPNHDESGAAWRLPGGVYHCAAPSISRTENGSVSTLVIQVWESLENMDISVSLAKHKGPHTFSVGEKVLLANWRSWGALKSWEDAGMAAQFYPDADARTCFIK